MSQNDQNRDQQQQGEGYQDPNEQDALDSRRDSIRSEPLTYETVKPQRESRDDEDDLDDLDELDEDHDDDQRESGPNRRFNIG